ncbi:hypothetical protein KM043_018148 [Ampulex compressa]|nr:hypothetical protein KM043_018148 [Ampulex compressa]
MTAKMITEFPAIPKPISLFIIALLSLCFVNSYDGEFVFDDTEAIVNNEDVRNGPLHDVFKNDFWGNRLSHKQSHKSYRPLTILTFRWQFWLRQELVSQDYHIVNIILHTIVCMLMLPVFNVLLRPKGENIAFYATALFAVHPVHAEAVSGVVGRAELLSALFTWLSLLLYDRSIHARQPLSGWSNMCGCIMSITVAMLCKETGITAVGICFIYDIVTVNNLFPVDVLKFMTKRPSYTELRIFMKSKQRLLIRFFILFLSTIGLMALRLYIMGFTAPKFQPVDNPASFIDNLFLRALNYSYVYCLNIWLLICPEWLCFDWSMGCVPLITEYDKRLIAICVYWMVFGAFMLHTFKARQDCFLRYSIMERTLYVPSAGYCLLIVIGLHKLSARFAMPNVLLLSYIMLILLFFTKSWVRSDQWRTEKTLFRSALNICPLNAKVHYNIAKNAADAGNSVLALYEYEEALRLNPNYAQAMNNLGNLLKDQGHHLQAEILFKKAIDLQKDFATAWMNLGIVLSALKKYDECEKSYLTALSHRPKYPDCYYNLGVLYLEQKDYDKALKAWNAAIKQKQTHKRAWTNMILLLDDLGLSAEALKTAYNALKFIPDHASIYFNIANILGKQGKFLEAEIQFKNAITKNPTDPMFYTNLGVLYHRWNKFNEAENMYRKALELKSDLHSARDNLKKLIALKSSIK